MVECFRGDNFTVKAGRPRGVLIDPRLQKTSDLIQVYNG